MKLGSSKNNKLNGSNKSKTIENGSMRDTEGSKCERKSDERIMKGRNEAE